MRSWGTFLTGFAVSAAYWPGMLSAVFVPRWAVIAVLVPLLWRLDPRYLTAPMRWLLLFLVAAGAVSLLGSPDPLTGTHDLILMLVLCVAFVGGAGLHDLDDLMLGLASGLALSSAAVVGQMYGWKGIPVTSGWIPGGLFFNSEILAEFAVLVLIWGCARRNWFAIACSVLPVMATHSRVAALCLICALAYLLWKRERWAWYVCAALLGAAAIATMMIFLGQYKLETALHRLTLWGATVMAFEFFGNGLGWAQVAYPADRLVHSDALQAIAEIGVAALALLYIPWAVFVEGKRENVAERAVFVAVCIQVAVSFPLHFPATGFVAAVVAGWLVRDRGFVRLGHHNRRTENGAGLQRADAGHAGIAARCRRGGGAVSLRSVFARCAGSCAFLYPARGG